MSIEALRWALQIGEERDLAPTMRHVLLILGNRADEQGYLFPSVAWICARTGLSRRTVQTQLQAIGDAGLMSRDMRTNDTGGRTSDGMQLPINQPGLFTAPPRAEFAPPPAADARGGRISRTQGGAAAAPYTQDIKQEVKKTKAKPATALISDFQLPPWITPEAWAGYEAMRIRIRKPMTDRARDLIVKRLMKFKEGGHDPIAVLEQSERSSWTDVYPIKPEGANGQAGGQPRWWESDTAMEAMAKQHGVSTLGKTRFQLKAAIEEKLGRAH